MTVAAPGASGNAGGKVFPIMEHLKELRRRVMISVIALVIGVLGSIWPLTTYVIHALVRPAQQQVPGFKLHQFQLLDYWSTYFRVSIMLGIAIAMPVIVYQVLALVAPALPRSARRWLYAVVLGASGMFILGMFFAYYVELPRMLDFLLKPGNSDVQPLIGVAFYINTVTRIIVLTGLVFETPLIIMALAKAGIVTSRRLVRWWRYAVLASVVLAAFLAPSLNPVTPIVVSIPIFGLYVAGIILARFVEGSSLRGREGG